MASSPESPYAWGFATDTDTERALRAGLKDHKAKIQRGRVEVALRTLAAEPAPRLVFVDLDGHPEPETAARELTSVCAFDTALIAIGSTDSAEFVRVLLGRGIADYLVKPISAALVRDAGATVTDDLPRRPYAGRVIAFAGSAGSGTSTLVAEVTRDAATDGRTASVVDLDPLSGKLSALLDTAPAGDLPGMLAALAAPQEADAEPTISAGRLDSVCVPAAPGISLIAYPPTGPVPDPPSPEAACALVRHLANRTHLVLVTGASDPEVQWEIMREADARVLVFEPTLTSISATVRRLGLLGPEHQSILVQCASRIRNSPLSSAHVRYALADRRPDVVIPFEPALRALSNGKSSARFGRAYRKAVRRVVALAIAGETNAAP